MEQKITITLHKDGQITMDGPLGNKVLCYGLLEIAKDLVRNYVQSPIMKPTNGGLQIIKPEA